MARVSYVKFQGGVVYFEMKEDHATGVIERAREVCDSILRDRPWAFRELRLDWNPEIPGEKNWFLQGRAEYKVALPYESPMNLLI